ncbi:MAG: hypothetical protein HY673_13010 [Chloroflexi bacterium]|nr:hypothetical protein [Chloroflexota bacterium]
MEKIAILDKIPKFEVMGIPVSDAAKGMLAAGAADVVSLVAARYFPQAPGYAVKGVEALLLQQKPVKQILGDDAANVASLILTYEAMRGAWDGRAKVRNELAKLVGKILPPPATPATNPPGQPATPPAAGSSPAASAEDQETLRLLGQ